MVPSSIKARIREIQSELASLEEFRTGTLSEQFNVCGTPSCRCKANPPVKHGPYYQISFTRKGRSQSRHVRREDLDIVRRQLDDYRQFKTLIDEWMDLASQLCELTIRSRHQA